MRLFPVHFVKILAMVEGNGMSKFSELNDNLQEQIAYVNSVISADEEYDDMGKFAEKYMKNTSSQPEIEESPTDKAHRARQIRDRGNKAYAKKDFDGALRYFSLSILTGHISRYELH